MGFALRKRILTSKCYRKNMPRRALIFISFLLAISLLASAAYGQREREIQPPPENSVSPLPVSDNSVYGRQFFIQLRSVFGRFRDSDLRRAFDGAQPIQCSELVNDPGIWKTVAFFNEKRELGDWYRSNLEEVKNDLAAFTFKGVCRAEQTTVLLTTKFPVTETVQSYNQGKIPLDQIDVNVNAPVRASFDEQSRAYAFDLPYLFLVNSSANENTYSLDPPTLNERSLYARDVINHWDCKSVAAEAVTYQFLICRTMTLARDPRVRSQQRAAFGATAYFILSDGKEASSSVKFTFNDDNDNKHVIDDSRAETNTDAARAAVAWTKPDSDERIMDIVREEFRIRFSHAAWSGGLSSAEVLAGQRLSSLKSSQPAASADICIWFPGSGSLDVLISERPEEAVAYSVSAHDREGQSPTTIVFDMKTRTGAHLGSLQCTFPKQTSATGVGFGEWTAVVGPYLALEAR